MYRRESETITGGNLNVAVPPDRVPKGDSISVHNFRADAFGALRSRPSASSLGLNLGGYVHTIFRRADYLYYGVAGAVRRGSTVIASGLEWDTALGDRPVGLAAYQGWTWIMNRAADKQLRDNGSTCIAWTPAAPAAAPSLAQSSEGGSLVEGAAYTYWVTFVTDSGEETNPNPGDTAITITAGNNTVTVTRPSSSDSRVTHWNIYRKGNQLWAPMRVNRDPWPMTLSTFVDFGNGDSGDEEVMRLGLALEFDHEPPPRAAGVVGPFYGRMAAYSSEQHPNRLWFTPINRPWYFRPDDYVDVGEDDEILTVTMHPGHLRIYTNRSVWRLRGDPFSGGALERTNAEVGIVGPRAIASAGGLDYLQGREGIYRSNGDTVVKITAAQEPLFRNGVPFPGDADPAIGLNANEIVRKRNCLTIKNGRLYFSYSDATFSSPNRLLVCDLNTLRWTTEDPPGLSAGWTALFYEGQDGDLVGASNGSIWKLEQGSTGDSRQLKWISGYSNQGTDDRQKRYADLVVRHSCARNVSTTRTLAVKLKTNAGDPADLSLGTITVSAPGSGEEMRLTPFRIPDDTIARNAAVLVEGSSEYEVALYEAILHYSVEPRDALEFRTGPIDLGDPSVKACDLLWVDIWPTATVNWTVFTDLPGSAVAQRVSGSIPAGGRVPIPLQLTAGGIEGRIVDVRLTSTGTFRLYAARLRYRRIGLYLDGSQANVWTGPTVMPAL